MTNLLQEYEQTKVAELKEGKEIPDFQAGDNVRVNIWIVEGKNKRIQAFEGLCIARKNKGINSAFTVRKISHGEGVERVFPLYSPLIEKIEVVRRGDVRRAKLYYMRGLTGKAARIKEKQEIRPAKDKKADNKKSKKAAAKVEAKADTKPKAEEAKKD